MILAVAPDSEPVTEPPGPGLLETVSVATFGIVRETLAAELAPLTLNAATVQVYADPAVRPVTTAEVPETTMVPPPETA